MKTPKYKITEQILDTPGEIKRLESDGHTRQSIVQALYRTTDGMNTQQRTAMMAKLYERGK